MRVQGEKMKTVPFGDDLDLDEESPLLMSEVLIYRNVKRFRGVLAFRAHGLCVSLNSRLERNKEEDRAIPFGDDLDFDAEVRVGREHPHPLVVAP